MTMKSPSLTSSNAYLATSPQNFGTPNGMLNATPAPLNTTPSPDLMTQVKSLYTVEQSLPGHFDAIFASLSDDPTAAVEAADRRKDFDGMIQQHGAILGNKGVSEDGMQSYNTLHQLWKTAGSAQASSDAARKQQLTSVQNTVRANIVAIVEKLYEQQKKLDEQSKTPEAYARAALETDVQHWKRRAEHWKNMYDQLTKDKLELTAQLSQQAVKGGEVEQLMRDREALAQSLDEHKNALAESEMVQSRQEHSQYSLRQQHEDLVGKIAELQQEKDRAEQSVQDAREALRRAQEQAGNSASAESEAEKQVSKMEQRAKDNHIETLTKQVKQLQDELNKANQRQADKEAFTASLPAVLATRPAPAPTAFDSGSRNPAQTADWICAPPTALPNGGVFSRAITVDLLPRTAGASVFFTLDGSVPDPAAAAPAGPCFAYRGSFQLADECRIMAVAAKEGFRLSEVFRSEPFRFSALAQASPTFARSVAGFSSTQYLTQQQEGVVGMSLARREKLVALESREVIYVRTVIEGGPADKAGVRSGDVILAAAGVEVEEKQIGIEALKRLLQGPSGQAVSVTVERSTETGEYTPFGVPTMDYKRLHLSILRAAREPARASSVSSAGTGIGSLSSARSFNPFQSQGATTVIRTRASSVQPTASPSTRILSRVAAAPPSPPPKPLPLLPGHASEPPTSPPLPPSTSLPAESAAAPGPNDSWLSPQRFLQEVAIPMGGSGETK